MELIEKVSAGGLIIKDDQVLVLYVPSHDETVFPKGIVESDESFEETAIREILEETGYHVEVVDELGSNTYEFEEFGKRYRKTVHYFLMKLVDEKEIPQPNLQPGEEFEAVWLPINQALEKLTHQENKVILSRAVEKLKNA